MLGIACCLILMGAYTSLGSSLSSHPLTLRARLEDHSWNSGHSSLVARGADPTCRAIFSCANCTTAQICRPTSSGLVPVDTIPCPADRPYCEQSTGSCTTVPDDSCGQKDDFLCMQKEGHFPDPNCTYYHVCENYVPHKFECKIKGQTYNADTQKCETTSQCAKFGCDGTGKKVSSSLFASYYAYCAPGEPDQPLVVDRCPGINQLNSTSQLCEPICSEEGVLEDVEDCTKYYKCSYLWLNDTTKFMIRERLDCPNDTGFDPSNFICVSLSEIPSCQAPTVPPTTTTTTEPTTEPTTPSTTTAPTKPTTTATTTKPPTEPTKPPTTTQPPTSTTKKL